MGRLSCTQKSLDFGFSERSLRAPLFLWIGAYNGTFKKTKDTSIHTLG